MEGEEQELGLAGTTCLKIQDRGLNYLATRTGLGAPGTFALRQLKPRPIVSV